MEYAIQFTDLTKMFGNVRAVDDLCFGIKEKSFFGFLGPNGAGKTTTIRMATGLLKPGSGTVEVLGYDVVKNPLEVKANIGYLPEDLNLYERLTVSEFLEFVGRIYGLEMAVLKDRIDELLNLLQLKDKENELIVDLSHGMKKKTALLGALIHDPKILFLDEPFTGIDPISSRVIKDLLEDLSKKGTTIFLSSHILEVVEKLCNEVAIINKGKIVGHGDLGELRKRAKIGDESTLEEVFLKLVEAQPPEGVLSWKK